MKNPQGDARKILGAGGSLAYMAFLECHTVELRLLLPAHVEESRSCTRTAVCSSHHTVFIVQANSGSVAFVWSKVSHRHPMHRMRPRHSSHIQQAISLSRSAPVSYLWLNSIPFGRLLHCHNRSFSVKAGANQTISYSRSLMLSRHVIRCSTITSRSPSMPRRTTSSCDTRLNHTRATEMLFSALEIFLLSSVVEFVIKTAVAL